MAEVNSPRPRAGLSVADVVVTPVALVAKVFLGTGMECS